MSTTRPLAISGLFRPRFVMLVALATAGIVLSVFAGVAQAAEPLESPTPGLAMAEPRVGHSSTLLSDGSVLIIGGVGNELETLGGLVVAPALASAEIWSPE